MSPSVTDEAQDSVPDKALEQATISTMIISLFTMKTLLVIHSCSFTISLAAISGVSSPKTLCLQGIIQGLIVRILVDSGSSHTFVSQVLADKLSGVQSNSSAMKV